MSSIAAAGALALALTVTAAHAATLELAAGATGSTSTTPSFRGGWGVRATLGHPVTPYADVLVRADYHGVPDQERGSVTLLYDENATSSSLFGPWPSGVSPGWLGSVMTGVRLHGAPSRFQTYLDALVGVGHASLTDPASVVVPVYLGGRPQVRDDTNVALSFGSGMRIAGVGPGSISLDAHLEFYFVPMLQGAIVPVRLGYGIPFGG
jgi:hypothetical protein